MGRKRLRVPTVDARRMSERGDHVRLTGSGRDLRELLQADDGNVNRRRLIVAFILFFLSALLPRLELIAKGYAFADDFAHGYLPHLQSYRPLLAAETWFWESIVGPGYLLTPLPRVLSGLWSASAFTAFLLIGVRVGGSYGVSVLAGMLTLLHPAFNELVLWGVLESTAFATAVGAIGAALAICGPRRFLRAIGLLLLGLSATGNQVSICLGLSAAALVWFSLRLRCQRVPASALRSLLLLSAVGPLVSVVTLLVMREWLGFEDFASRTLSVERDVSQFGRSKFLVLSNALANVYQAPLALAGGDELALRAFWWIAIGTPVLVFTVARFVRRMPSWQALLLSAVAPILYLLALLPLLGTTQTPTGFRLMGAALLVLATAAAFVASVLLRAGPFRVAAAPVAIVVAWANIGASWKDVRVRETAWARDADWASSLKEAVVREGRGGAELCSVRFTRPNSGGDGIVVSYDRATTDAYSIWYSQFLASYLREQGVVVTTRPHDDRGAPAEVVRRVPFVSRSTNLWLELDEGRGPVVVCGESDSPGSPGARPSRVGRVFTHDPPRSSPHARTNAAGGASGGGSDGGRARRSRRPPAGVGWAGRWLGRRSAGVARTARLGKRWGRGPEPAARRNYEVDGCGLIAIADMRPLWHRRNE